MSESAASEVTATLAAIREGNEQARQRLVELVYDELKRLGHGMMAGERAGHTLQTTALVHEALRKLLEDEVLAQANNRRYFFGAAVQAMRRILVDHAKAKRALKRGGDHQRVPLDDILDVFEQRNLALLGLDEALKQLAALHERQHEIVMLRFFGGLTNEEIAEQLAVSLSTVESDWRNARAWLRSRLKGHEGEPSRK